MLPVFHLVNKGKSSATRHPAEACSRHAECRIASDPLVVCAAWGWFRCFSLTNRVQVCFAWGAGAGGQQRDSLPQASLAPLRSYVADVAPSPGSLHHGDVAGGAGVPFSPGAGSPSRVGYTKHGDGSGVECSQPDRKCLECISLFDTIQA